MIGDDLIKYSDPKSNNIEHMDESFIIRYNMQINRLNEQRKSICNHLD